MHVIKVQCPLPRSVLGFCLAIEALVIVPCHATLSIFDDRLTPGEQQVLTLLQMNGDDVALANPVAAAAADRRGSGSSAAA